ncbi:MAG: maltose alpha-D-glucosyltransferase [Pirellulaceae bacterium]
MATRTEKKQATKIKPVTASDRLWFKDAIIYQLHVRSFGDSNGDGIGDFRGLTERLDYIRDLGVTAIWLLPFFPSPLRDDGYDTSDYVGVNRIYGSLRDFKALLFEAHQRELRVITEMVMNHTSDQHAWFQKSRRAKPGEKWRDYYVWSDTPDRYREARVIFQDFEQSNWSWDPLARAYYWHRFYHHQPDLNYDNPEVRRAMLNNVDFWLGMGVDAFRLDAVPYLYQREGTNCENLPETHAFLKELRRHVDSRFTDKMLLAEANQWPEDAAAYFGQGDECHMNFHFPIMPRLFMAIEREDRFPITDILEQTPTIPETCQWGIFLRNHDELTLEMVTDEERDYMYRAYADDPRARLNLGIRRRLAPLLKNDRRKIELMNALLLSLPGTPIIYYGDELGMGDNVYLGDRDGVRTPMQWNADRNAGFSQANPQRLYLPPIIDAEYHYAALNVEVQQNSPHSLLWWMRRIIGLRKQFQAFGRGTMEILSPDNSKVLAFLRRYNDETLLVVANLSRFAQCAELDLSTFRGQRPMELFGQTTFPSIGALPYFLTLGPHAFYWFRLAWPAEEAGSLGVELPSCTISGRWDNLFRGRARTKLELVLPAFLRRQPWFGGATRTIQGLTLADVIPVPGPQDVSAMRMLLVQVDYVEGEQEMYLLPVVFARGRQAWDIIGDHPRSGILKVERSDGMEPATLCDAMWEERFWHPLYEAIARKRSLVGERGEIVAEQTKVFRDLSGAVRRREEAEIEAHLAEASSSSSAPPTVTIPGGEHSNTSVILGDRLILKIFRRLGMGENPELEIGRFLTGQSKLTCVPRLVGAVEYRPGEEASRKVRSAAAGQPMTIGVMHELVPNEGDAWAYTLDELGRYGERVESEMRGVDPGTSLLSNKSLLELAALTPPEVATEMIGSYLQSAELLGRRTAEMHTAFAQGDDEAFVPKRFSRLYQRSLYQSLRGRARRGFTMLRKRLANLPEAARPAALRVAEMEEDVLGRFGQLLDRSINALRTRGHGDYHLGQVLFTGNNFVIIDFEGEPQRPVSERRIKTSPLRDVAGMIRSFHYASHVPQQGEAPGAVVPRDPANGLQLWLHLWYAWSAAAFLRTYVAEAAGAGFLPANPDELRILLEAYLLDKAIDDLGYELNNRPDWVGIPLEAMLHLLESR